MYTLLVIDDEPLVRRGIVSLIPFEELGVSKVLEAENGEKGIALVKECKPDIILCDINMPKMNGLEFSQRVKDEYPWIKIAIITGYDYFDYARKAIKTGVEDYVLKPVSKNDVYEVVASLIEKIKKDATLNEVYKTIKNDQDEKSRMSSVNDYLGYKKQIDEIFEQYYCSREFSLSFLAQKLALNDNYLSTLFKKTYNTTFQEYLLTKRLEKSKVLLLTTSMRNYEIAEEIGIIDANYFSTLFKKRYGDSPSKYKKKVQKGGI